MSNGKLHRVILNLKAIQCACFSAAQEDTDNAIITMDKEAQEALGWAVEQLEKKSTQETEKMLIGGVNE